MSIPPNCMLLENPTALFDEKSEISVFVSPVLVDLYDKLSLAL